MFGLLITSRCSAHFRRPLRKERLLPRYDRLIFDEPLGNMVPRLILRERGHLYYVLVYSNFDRMTSVLAAAELSE